MLNLDHMRDIFTLSAIKGQIWTPTAKIAAPSITARENNSYERYGWTDGRNHGQRPTEKRTNGRMERKPS